ncbi:hypothetical protein PMKS-003194 [Pichia membranifaciens]|uniref:Serine/threonine-protein kinase ATG1 n=1 Tax=Pichia membranifaciens TaxID=4926 RepID=A0A1Q2YJH1_9ASCO|nr:hypothetical protein PMKS-003194 [Pichia membranifaciens]
MDYCSLGDLSYFIRKKTQLSNHHPIIKTVLEKYPSPANSNGLNEFLVVNFAKQLSSALKFLRSQNLVHRDIKPQNLLLCSPAHSKDEFVENHYTGFWELPILKVADFGFARYLPSTSMAETLCGSPLYMAPEILRYEKYNAKADLWSVGTVIYEMVVGKPPFRASNHIELLKKIEKSNDQINFPTDFEISQDLIRLICNLLKANPTDRMGFNEFFSDPVLNSNNDNYEAMEESISYSVENEEMYVSEYLVGKDQNESNLPKTEKNVINQKPSASAIAASLIKQKAKKQILPNQFERQIQEPLNKLVIEEGDEDEFETNGSDNKLKEDPPANNLKSNASNGIVTRENVENRIRPKSMEKSVEELLQEQQKAIKSGNGNGNNDTNHTNSPVIVKLNGRDQMLSKKKSRVGDDIIVEKDYVVVEKRNVEVNTFADEISKASKPLKNPERHSLSKQRRYSMSVSPSGALKEVLDYTTERLFGATNSTANNNIGSTSTEALSNNNFDDDDHISTSKSPDDKPNETNKTGSPDDKVDINKIILGRNLSRKNTNLNSRESNDKIDQIDGIINKIERFAMMAHAISLYAEIKFDQVIPLPPSSNNNESNHFVDVIDLDDYNRYAGAIVAEKNTNNSERKNNSTNSNTLQYNSVYRKLCQEGLALYLKTLLFLGEAIKASSEWWANNKYKSNITPMMGELIQWIRNRFNESLEKAEYLKLRMNRFEEDENTAENNGEPNFICEKIIFDRAIEISKDTAIKELGHANDVNELKKCEIAYSLSVWMLESLLYQPREGDRGSLERGDQDIVENFINSIGTRLLILKSKIDSQSKGTRTE